VAGTALDATVEAIEIAVYTIPTDAPQVDGILAWDSTTIGVVADQHHRPGRRRHVTSSGPGSMVTVAGTHRAAVRAAVTVSAHRAQRMPTPVGLSAAGAMVCEHTARNHRPGWLSLDREGVCPPVPTRLRPPYPPRRRAPRGHQGIGISQLDHVMPPVNNSDSPEDGDRGSLGGPRRDRRPSGIIPGPAVIRVRPPRPSGPVRRLGRSSRGLWWLSERVDHVVLEPGNVLVSSGSAGWLLLSWSGAAPALSGVWAAGPHSSAIRECGSHSGWRSQ
jgi:hypothetical protein